MLLRRPGDAGLLDSRAQGRCKQAKDEVFVDLRAFVLPAIDYLMPDGRTRVAQTGTRVVNSTAGGSGKDTLVLEEYSGFRQTGFRASRITSGCRVLRTWL